ncbi:MAG: helix-turn-helix domain-containing protein [Halobacteriota archaeon]
MRYITAVLSPEDGTFHPVDGIVADNPDLYRGRVLHVKLLQDGTVIALYAVGGDRDALESELEAHPDVLEHNVFDVDDEMHVYVHVEYGEPVVELLSISDERKLMVDMPIEFVEGGVRVTVIGEQETLQRAIDQLPDDINIEIEQVGRYSPDDDRILSLLTERQREALEAAVRHGYYDVPRKATHEEVADEMGCAPSTAAEHLRKLESRIAHALVEDE